MSRWPPLHPHTWFLLKPSKVIPLLPPKKQAEYQRLKAIKRRSGQHWLGMEELVAQGKRSYFASLGYSEPGAYGHLMINAIFTYLTEEETEEYRRLERRKNRRPDVEPPPDVQARLEELWAMASERRKAEKERLAAEPPDTWFDQLAERMWKGLSEDERAYWTAANPTAAAKYLSAPL